MSEFYNDKSHLIPPSGLVFNQFFDNLMLKNKTQDSDNIDIFGQMDIENEEEI